MDRTGCHFDHIRSHQWDTSKRAEECEALDRRQTTYLGRSCPRREGRIDAIDVERQIRGLPARDPNRLLRNSLQAHPRHLIHKDDAHPTCVGVVPSLVEFWAPRIPICIVR